MPHIQAAIIKAGIEPARAAAIVQAAKGGCYEARELVVLAFVGRERRLPLALQ